MRNLLIVLVFLIFCSITTSFTSDSVNIKAVEPVNDTIELYYCGYLDTVTVDTTRVVPTISHTKINHDSLEWYMFPDSVYNLPISNWTKEDKVLFTNVLVRESGSLRKGNRWAIDQYLVAICAYRSYLEKTNKTIRVQNPDRMEFVGNFRMAADTIPSFKHDWDEKAWHHCYQIVEDVLSGNIPDFVPFIPPGTFCYARVEHCTDLWWVSRLQDPDVFTKVGHTIKGHQYFCYLKYNKQMHTDSLYAFKDMTL